MGTIFHTPFSAVRSLARPLDGAWRDYDELLAMTEGKRVVLLGEATHGSAEFYRMRAEITQRLIVEQGFEAVAIEGDWPDAWRVDRYVGGYAGASAEGALAGFERFPRWMWRNREVLAFIRWLREHNAGLSESRRVGFYGLDLYGMYRSADDVVAYLESVDPAQADIARHRYAALDHVRDPQAYGYAAAMALRPVCQEVVARQLRELRLRAKAYREVDGLPAHDAQFAAERNAAAIVNAEIYYRAMFGLRTNTWNLRDAHMRDTLLALSEHRLLRGGEDRIVVWAHNSHVGDARACEMSRHGEWSLGQLVRDAMGGSAVLVGFTTYTGEVCAAEEWGGEARIQRVLPALTDSVEHLFHSTGLDRFFLPLRDPAAWALSERRLERAIGVVYRPWSERASHYFEASIRPQFDAIFHIDETSAVEPLENAEGETNAEPPTQRADTPHPGHPSA